MYYKKGDANYEIVSIILAIVSLVILAAFLIWNFGTWANKTVTQESCRASILSKSTFVGRNNPLKCPTEKVVIGKINEDEVEEEVAGLLYDAWSITGEGKVNFWDRLGSRTVIPQKDIQCLIFTTFTFSEDVKKQRNTPFDNFDKYLTENKIPGKNESYMDYLNNEIKEGVFSYYGPNSLDPTESYSIIIASTNQNLIRAGVEKLISLSKGDAIFILLMPTKTIISGLKCGKLL